MRLRLSAISILLLLAASSLLASSSGEGSVRPILSNEVISTVGSFNSSLAIYLIPMCENDNIVFRVTRFGVPVPNVEVSFRSFGGGIHDVAFTYTTPDGWGAFTRKPAGRYDLVARIDNVTMGQIFFMIPPCLSPPSGVGNKPAVPSPPSVPYSTQSYVNGLSREFYDIMLPDGRPATWVVLRTGMTTFQPDQWLMEPIPVSVASSPDSVGFEQDYPDQIALNSTLTLSWSLGRTQQGAFERGYVIYRTLNEQIISQFGSPALIARPPAPPSITNNQTLPAADSPSSPSSTQSPLGLWIILGVLAVLVVGSYWLFGRKSGADKEGTKKE